MLMIIYVKTFFIQKLFDENNINILLSDMHDMHNSCLSEVISYLRAAV